MQQAVAKSRSSTRKWNFGFIHGSSTRKWNFGSGQGRARAETFGSGPYILRSIRILAWDGPETFVFLIGRWLLAAFDRLRVASAMRPLDAADWAVGAGGRGQRDDRAGGPCRRLRIQHVQRTGAPSGGRRRGIVYRPGKRLEVSRVPSLIRGEWDEEHMVVSVFQMATSASATVFSNLL